MSAPATREWIDPRVLRVEWLEHAMLVHAVTITTAPRSPEVHWLFGGALGAGAAATLAVWAAQPAIAAGLGAVWLGCAGRLGVLAYRVAKAAPPVRQRLLIELRPEQLSWTLLTGDRWSMQHQHELPFPTLSSAAPVGTPTGPEVQLRLRDGSSRSIPLHGLPGEDAAWLAERIGEGIEAAAEPDDGDEA